MNSKYLKPAINYEMVVKICGERFAGHGLLSETNHERWSHHRRVLNPAFHRKYLMELMYIFEDSAKRLTDFLATQADGEKEVNLKDAFERVALDVVAKAGFSIKEDMISKRTTCSDAIAFCFDGALKGSLNPFLRVNKEKNSGENLIRQRLQDQKEGKNLPKDILSYIIKTAMVEENFQLEEMVDEFMTFFVAGQETTGNLLAFTMICLGQNPHVMQKLLQEVDSVIGDKEDLLYEDITKLEYMMLLLTFVMSRQEQFFKDPLTFEPERFTREEDSKLLQKILQPANNYLSFRPLYSYFPFSMGPRSCIGQQFALVAVGTVVVGATMLALVFAVMIARKRYKFRHVPHPPVDSLIIGHSGFLSAVRDDKTTYAEYGFNLHHQYGPVFCLFIFHMAFVFAADPKTVKVSISRIVQELLMNSKYLKPELNHDVLGRVGGERFVGNGLIVITDHERWSHHRRVLNPAFHRKYLMELMYIFEDSAKRLTDFLATQADGEKEAGFSIKEDMISNRTAFSDAIEFCFYGATKMSQSPLLWWDPRKEARDFRKKLKSDIRLLRNTGENLIRQRLQDQKEGKDLPKDILSYIIKTAMLEENFQLEEMVDEFMTFFVAGQETTGNLLAFTMICVGQNPHVMQKLIEEVDSVIGDKEVLLYEDIAKLEYMMLVSTFTMSRQEQFFKDPMTFDPDRFTREEDSPLYAYFPFSLGPRSCIGQQFALVEARVVLTKLLQKLKFQLVPGQNFGITERLTLKPADDCRHYLLPREKG
ncbi:Cholesterol 24-hydroxylase [Holothuria leucospilota]|uniref:Cholesterol 24-hydroxylase n=1 Tax=Holothuria leucospilota TaxID=206669 RepID=A0A9Q1CIX6_HOLLE|nr:Cholesterol 24-hydroxylase [Holothuria leucospilota]